MTLSFCVHGKSAMLDKLHAHGFLSFENYRFDIHRMSYFKYSTI